MRDVHNQYILAGRYNALPAKECAGIINALESLIETSDDDMFVEDARLRLEAVKQRLNVA